jgi:hypothetical protein
LELIQESEGRNWILVSGIPIDSRTGEGLAQKPEHFLQLRPVNGLLANDSAYQ